MTRIAVYIFFLAALFVSPVCKGQETGRFNLNIYNDLPSNNVYNITVDHLGYLWIATDKGVVKYNGYNLRGFDLNKEFINKDTWNLFEDKNGRMWLFSISDNLTYIYNNVAHNVVTLPSMGVFYPHCMFNYKNGIAFLTSFTNQPDVHFCFIRNDSIIYTQKITKYGEFINIDTADRLVTFSNDGNFYKLEVSKNALTPGLAQPLKNYDGDVKKLLSRMQDNRYGTIGLSFFSYTHNKNYIELLNSKDQTYRKIVLDSAENIKIIGGRPENIIAITDHKIFYFDSVANIKGFTYIDSGIEKLNGNNVTFELNNPFWGKTLATNTKGIFFQNPTDTFFRKKLQHPEDLKCLGAVSDSVSFWYSRGPDVIYKIVNGEIVKKRETNIIEIYKIIPYTDRQSILLNILNSYTINNNTLETVDLGAAGGKNAIVYSKNEMLGISNIKGFNKVKIEGDSLKVSKLEQNRYVDILYDSLRQMFVVYNNRKILLYKDNQVLFTIERKDLEQRSINNINKIMLDNKYGNVFIQENDRLIYFPDLMRPYRRLFGNYILNSAKMCLHHDILIASDAFGILFAKIEGPGKISEPVLYPNIKCRKYKFVYDIQVSGNVVLLKTDKGIFKIAMPTDFKNDSIARNSFLDYKMVISNNGHVYEPGDNDTLKIVKKYRKLQFDIIKPTGYGNVSYVYKLSDELARWTELSNDELSLPKMLPGKYYTLQVIAYDKQWSSYVRTVVIYMEPEWYEETIMQRIMWIGGLFLLIGAIYFIVIVTKRIVTKNEAQKNLKLELELKSVYSQINPHFIFNSLTAALYLIKTGKLDDAYNHIYKFSHLLRSYIKSSRNRLITLGEEIKNLTNYIELQQARFKNKFDYEITIDPLVSSDVNIPSLLLQPIVENAITHGLLHKTEKGKLLVEFKLHPLDSVLICNIEDDGIGREQSKNKNSEHFIKEESYGSELIKDLIDIFNKYEKMKIEIEYLDKQFPLTGTIVQLRIKALS